MGDEDDVMAISVNELLYYLQNAINSLHKNDISATAEKYFTKEEIEKAKLTLWTRAGHLTKEKNTKRTGTNACKTNLSDMLELLYIIDNNCANIRFASIDASKIPPIIADSKDIGLLRNEVKLLREQSNQWPMIMAEMLDLKSQMGAVLKVVNSHANSNSCSSNSIENAEGRLKTANASHSNSLPTTEHEISSAVSKVQKSKLKLSNDLPNGKQGSSNEWTTVVKKRTIGKSSLKRGLLAAPVVKNADLHVTRLHVSTTGDELTQFVRSNNFNVLCCEALKTRYDSYKSFKLTVELTDTCTWENIYNAEFWPTGVMVRKFFNVNNGSRKSHG